jgi:hypothetical protein
VKKQQAFNLAYLGVTSQGKPSVDLTKGSNYCLFNGPDGCHCNIGWLADLEKEDTSLDTIAAKLHIDLDFLRELQASHDGAVGHHYVSEKAVAKRDKGFIARYKASMAQLAHAHNLRVPLQ